MYKNHLLKGALLLTAAGVFSRIIGFFYRIFLSRTFGAEQMGIYELISPVLALSFALCTSAIQSSISKFTAAEPEAAIYAKRRILLTGLSVSFVLSCLCTLFVWREADFISDFLLKETRCAPLLKIAALSFPAACIHSCINGYYYGIRKSFLPAFCQVFEQCFRVGSVMVFWQYATARGLSCTIQLAAVGLVIGECASMAVSVFAARIHFSKKLPESLPLKLSRPELFSRLFSFAAPLCATRVCLHLLGTIESSRIPVSLQLFGYSSHQALSAYGVYTGMAMTCILFPGALTNSIAVLLMPTISCADASNNQSAIYSAIFQCTCFCLFIGVGCTAVFSLCGNFIGSALFGNVLAGQLIRMFCFLCPFLYLNTTLLSILNGLGKTGCTFLFQILSLAVRLFFVFFILPLSGIPGLFQGMLFGQMLLTILCAAALFFVLSRRHK